MKNHIRQILILFLFSFSLPAISPAQSNYNSPQKNAFTFNLGQYLANEINLGYEHFFSEKNSVELNGGLIYRNEFLLKQAKDWSNSQYFYERGFAARFLYKIYHNAKENSGRKNYYSFGVNYQYLYFNNEWFETDKDIKVLLEPGTEVTTKEEIYRHRFRNRIGLQLTLGNVIPMGNTFGLEVYYGLGLRGIFSDRFDVARGANVNDEQLTLQTLNFADQKFYVRPAIHAGIKLRLGW